MNTYADLYNMTPMHSLLYFTIYTIIKIAGEILQTWLKRAILTEQISINKMIIILCIIVLQIPFSATLYAYSFNYTTQLLINQIIFICLFNHYI